VLLARLLLLLLLLPLPLQLPGSVRLGGTTHRRTTGQLDIGLVKPPSQVSHVVGRRTSPQRTGTPLRAHRLEHGEAGLPPA
jgi:hypothetical protein